MEFIRIGNRVLFFIRKSNKWLISICSTIILLLSFIIQHAEGEVEIFENKLDFMLNFMLHSSSLGNSYKLQQLIALENAHFYDNSIDKSESSAFSNYHVDSLTVEKYFKILTKYDSLRLKGVITTAQFYSLSSRLSQIESEGSSFNHELTYKAHVDISKLGTKWKSYKAYSKNTQLFFILLVMLLSIFGVDNKNDVEEKSSL